MAEIIYILLSVVYIKFILPYVVLSVYYFNCLFSGPLSKIGPYTLTQAAIHVPSNKSGSLTSSFVDQL